MPFNLDIADPLARIQDFWTFALETADPSTTYDSRLYPHLHPHSATVHSATSCTATFLFDVPRFACNRLGALQGGASATIFDVATSVAVAPLAVPPKRDGDLHWFYPGVSRTLTVTYLRPIPLGMKVAVVCEVVGFSPRMAHIKAYMREWDEERGEEKGEQLALCEHGKINARPPKGVDPSKL